jgi:hypothetical protein
VFTVGGGIKRLKWTSQDLQEVAAGRIRWNAEAGKETSVGDVEAGFKQADLILDETLFQQSTPHQPVAMEWTTPCLGLQQGRFCLAR